MKGWDGRALSLDGELCELDWRAMRCTLQIASRDGAMGLEMAGRWRSIGLGVDYLGVCLFVMLLCMLLRLV